MQDEKIKEVVKKSYAKIASQNSGCGCSCNCGTYADNEQIAKSIGYSDEEINTVSEANLGLGCGNPIAMGEIKEGDIILDLGSGAGFDCFLASKKVGETGRVIGVDMTEEMIAKAEENAEKYGYKNVEFKLGEIENLPIEDNSIDVAISNCVINLVPDKEKAFREIYRVLKKDGKIYLSDIVLLDNIADELKSDEELLAGCVGGALLRDEYMEIIKKAGFEVKILSEDKDISKRQYQGIPLESLKIEAIKK
ncbi:MAG: Transcriptional regulator, ArsR family [Candidatus Moranbacteria bacterium GW2011_GWE2_35_2-]|nr:MAG: Transcriptional regulator, ArsR family [Candidatus Moranbacteria bacterium GW2011_GWE2_35_2-]KKQ04597.1 MAG: Transcriptional regulator, ArsR family [Candidatus Moranbacteria bacterium GW2011_GWF1_36_4]KKQ22052.1 MAG: Transcriptional regulator, ArsR family [Candidatus Moranbacteria bacterium GW2011_GWF2_37_11]KKQ29194.1 MAG: Transcriptional regulator, ArsR family [Candidatus Moranbacteria bacterium GW2011_GWD1_37_17]KKQ31179.1 MAG: Transcriptional regulator, ArsR family [Candidatus Moran